MKKKFISLLMAAAIAFSATACGGSELSDSEPSDQSVEEEAEESDANQEEVASEDASDSLVNIDMDKCIEDLKDGLSLDPDYSFVREYYIGVKDGTITITAVVDDATDPVNALDFADTLVRQLNLYAQMQDSSIEPSSKDFYGGLYERYNALVGISPASKTQDTKEWFVYDAISGGKTMLDLQKQYR